MSRFTTVLVATLVLTRFTNGQSQPPNVSQVLLYSATPPSVTLPGGVTLANAAAGVFTETKNQANFADVPGLLNIVSNPANFSSPSFVQLTYALNSSIATALSIIPLSSPASGVISRTDPATGAELMVNSTLGPIFTERAETVGKGKFYIGISNQDFHFTKLNGTSLNSLQVLSPGGSQSNVVLNGNLVPTVPATFSVGMDVRLSQDIAFLTYGVTDNFDVSLGLPMVHSAVSARTFNGIVYAGNGFPDNSGSTCWCANTFTPGFPTLLQSQFGQASRSKTGLGDVLLRLKGTAIRKSRMVVAIGGDVRFPTGDAANYLGVGTTTFKPFAAVSFYTQPSRRKIILSPHFDVGWQFSGKSMLGGELQGTPLSQSTASGTINYIGAPFVFTKNYLPDVFTWAAGTELALGSRDTIVADILGNQVGWIHGIPNPVTQTIPNVLFPTAVNGIAPASLGGPPEGQPTPTKVSAVGLVDGGNVSYGQYSGSFGYKHRVAGNLVANFNLLVRFDNNGLTARVVPLFGLGYSFGR